MKNLIIIPAIAVSLLVSLPAYSADTAEIHGTVVDENSVPVAGAVVRLATPAISDTTDAAGRFEFDGAPMGANTLTARKPASSLLPSGIPVTVSQDSSAAVVIRMHRRTYTVDEVVIIGSAPSRAEQLEHGPSQVDVVTRAEFQHTAVTVEDVIASTPSAAITSYGGLGSFSDVSLRGAYSNQVQVYVDGMLLNEAVGGSVNLGLIPLTNVDRVEIWRSGAPAGFGGDAVGGAINIITRDTVGSDASLSFSSGSFGTMTGHAIADIGSGESRTLVTLDGAMSRNDFEYTSDNGTPLNYEDDYTTYRRDNEFRTLNALVKHQRLVSPGMHLELSEHVLRTRKDLPNSQHILRSGASLVTTKNLLQSRLSWIPDALPWMELTPALHSILSHEHYRDTGSDVGWGAEDNVYETATWQGMLPVSVKYRIPGSITVTPVFKHESYSPEHRLDAAIPLSSRREQLGIAGDVEFHTPGGRFMMKTKIRRDRYYSDYEGKTNTINPVTPEAQFHHFTNLQTGFRFEAHPSVSLRWNYGDNWRAPGLYELFGDRGYAVSTPGLRPEHVFRWDIGARFGLPRRLEAIAGRFDIVYFESNYRNLIQWYTTNYGFIEAANVAGSSVSGTELVWNVSFNKSLHFRGNWTFQRSRVTESAKVYHEGKTLPNRPDHYGAGTVEYTRGRATIFWTVDHKDEYFLDRSNQPHKEYPGRTIHDIGLALGFDNSISCRFMMENITDQQTFDIQGMPKPGRSYTIRFSYSPERGR